MKKMIFPQADHFHVPKALFIGAWKVWFKRFSDHDVWRKGKMPLGESDAKLFEIIASGQRFTVEVAVRLMVPWSYRDTRQANKAFFLMNTDILKPTKMADEVVAEGVRLTDQALEYWDALTYLEQDMFTAYAEARIQADIETPSSEAVIIDDAGLEVIGEDIYPPIVPDKSASDEAFARAIVAWIDEDPFTPMYQRVRSGKSVSSWHDRLESFYWPKPRNGLMQVSHFIDPLLYRAGILAKGIEEGVEWSEEDKITAVKTTEEIFLEAGTPQKEVTWQNIHAVMKAALKQDTTSNAKMNSGWSLLAAFATHWLCDVEGRTAMVCWNSRVSASILSRLDFLMVEAGYETLEQRFSNLGTIPGWGGTRPREMSLKWPDGYRSWQTAVSASEFVGHIVYCLNHEKKADGRLKYAKMPIADGGVCRWTTLGVQLVLFSDGY